MSTIVIVTAGCHDVGTKAKELGILDTAASGLPRRDSHSLLEAALGSILDHELGMTIATRGDILGTQRSANLLISST